LGKNRITTETEKSKKQQLETGEVGNGTRKKEKEKGWHLRMHA
jgi:hypothetical protein